MTGRHDANPKKDFPKCRCDTCIVRRPKCRCDTCAKNDFDPYTPAPDCCERHNLPGVCPAPQECPDYTPENCETEEAQI